MNNTTIKLLRNVLLCTIGFVAGRALFFPGKLDPMVPSANDLYNYFLLAHSDLGFSMLQAPRPLMYLFLWFVGKVFQTPEMLWLSLAVLCVLFVGALVDLIERLSKLEFHPYAVVLYAATIFALPTSWQIYQLDFGGMLSGLLCIAGIHVFLSAKSSPLPYLCSALLYWAALEAKPTFGILLPVAAGIYAVQKRSPRLLATAVVLVGIGLLVILKDKIIGSPFVSSRQGNVYQLRLDPLLNIKVLLQYLTAAVPISLLPCLILSYANSWVARGTKNWVIAMPFLAATAVAPMALIPNRTLIFYSWYSSIFLFAPLLLSMAEQKSSSLRRSMLPAATLLATIIGLCTICSSAPQQCRWVTTISAYNANVMSSLYQLRVKAPEIGDATLLATGLAGPFHAFWKPDFVRRITGLKSHSRLLRRSENVWNERPLERGDGFYLDNFSPGNFKYYAVYNRAGRLEYLLSVEQFEKIPVWWRSAFLFGSGPPDPSKLSMRELLKAVTELDNAGEAGAASALRNDLLAERHLPKTSSSGEPARNKKLPAN